MIAKTQLLRRLALWIQLPNAQFQLEDSIILVPLLSILPSPQLLVFESTINSSRKLEAYVFEFLFDCSLFFWCDLAFGL